jgi:chromosome segregation ATPase
MVPMDKQAAEVLGVGGLIVGGLALLDSNQKGNTIDALQGENANLRDALRKTLARVQTQDRERGELMRARDVANGKLNLANERIDTLQAQATTIKRDLTDAQERIERVHRNLVESEGARQKLHNEMATKDAEHAAELVARDAAHAAEVAQLREQLEATRKASQLQGVNES